MIFLGIITSIIIFSIIVLIHEYGHFKTARFFGVKVEEFGIGIPPRAKKLFKDKSGTLFSLNWLPIGGFVKLSGESINKFNVYDKKGKLYNNENLEKDLKSEKDIFDKKGNKIPSEIKKEILEKINQNNASYNLINKPYWQQSIIVLAGVFMNFLLAIFIFSILFFIGVKPIGINTKIETNLDLKLIPNYEQSIASGLLEEKKGLILNPTKNSLAEKAGIKQGDILQKINGQEVNSYEKLKEILGSNKGKEIEISIIPPSQPSPPREEGVEQVNIPSSLGKRLERDLEGEIKILITLPNDGKIGTYISPNIKVNEEFEYKYGALESIKYGTLETYNQSLLTFKALGILARKIFNPKSEEERKQAINTLAGPIGIVDLITDSLQAGLSFLIIIGAIISINLGVFNLLPIPALDGGRFLFIVINSTILKIFGKKAINENIEAIIHIGFFIFLIALSILIGYNDISKIINN